MEKFFVIKDFGSEIKIKIFFIKIRFKKKYSLYHIFHKINHIIYNLIPDFPPPLKKYKLLYFSLIDKFYKGLYQEYYINNRKFSCDEVIKLFEVYEEFPKNILSVDETIDYILKNNCSVSRIGDGEELLNNMLGYKCKFENLKDKLINIYKQGSNENCLVCFNNFHAANKNVPMFFRKHFIDYWLCVSGMGFLNLDYNHKENYGDAYAFYFYFKESDTAEEKEAKIQKIKAIWNNKKILFVVNPNSKILNDEEVFNNVQKKDFIFIPSSDAFSEYENTKSAIIEKYDNSWLIYLECGPLATVLAYELSQLGYQAIDVGDFYNRIIYNK